MIIKSNFKDYYDGAMALGMNTDQVWLRKETVVLLERSDFPRLAHSRTYKGFTFVGLKCQEIIIGFCGKIYAALLVSPHNHKGLKDEEKTQKCGPAVCYNADEVKGYVEKHFKKKCFNDFLATNISWFKTQWHDCSYKTFAAYFKEVEDITSQFEEMFREYLTPVFVAKNSKIHEGVDFRNNKNHSWIRKFKLEVTFNGCLKDYEFYRVFDTFAAFQEIQMFYNNMAMPDKPIPEISDADMLEIKGFDPKYSFRKDPGKKKRRRNRKNNG